MHKCLDCTETSFPRWTVRHCQWLPVSNSEELIKTIRFNFCVQSNDKDPDPDRLDKPGICPDFHLN